TINADSFTNSRVVQSFTGPPTNPNRSDVTVRRWIGPNATGVYAVDVGNPGLMNLTNCVIRDGDSGKMIMKRAGANLTLNGCTVARKPCSTSPCIETTASGQHITVFGHLASNAPLDSNITVDGGSLAPVNHGSPWDDFLLYCFPCGPFVFYPF